MHLRQKYIWEIYEKYIWWLQEIWGSNVWRWRIYLLLARSCNSSYLLLSSKCNCDRNIFEKYIWEMWEKYFRNVKNTFEKCEKYIWKNVRNTFEKCENTSEKCEKYTLDILTTCPLLQQSLFTTELQMQLRQQQCYKVPPGIKSPIWLLHSGFDYPLNCTRLLGAHYTVCTRKEIIAVPVDILGRTWSTETDRNNMNRAMHCTDSGALSLPTNMYLYLYCT